MRRVKNFIKQILSRLFYVFIESDFGFDTITRHFPEVNVGQTNLSNREKWLESVLRNIPSGANILDAGAGELQYKKYCKHLKYVSQDFGQYTGDNSDEGLQIGAWDNSKLDIVSDIINIPVENGFFDAIMCVEVFEHLPEPTKAIKEFSRIVKSGGKLIITAPFCSLTHFAPFYYGNGYSKYWYEKILAENGFKIEGIDYNGNYFDYLAQEIRRISTIEDTYTKTELSKKRINLFAEKLLLKELSELSLKDEKSHELLCFGLHIVAHKK